MKWIKCSERMPDPKIYESVLTFEILTNIETLDKINCINLEDVESLYFDNELKCAYSDGGGENITHWMPLPNAPY